MFLTERSVTLRLRAKPLADLRKFEIDRFLPLMGADRDRGDRRCFFKG
jgi:hypothetical protein